MRLDTVNDNPAPRQPARSKFYNARFFAAAEQAIANGHSAKSFVDQLVAEGAIPDTRRNSVYQAICRHLRKL